MTRPDILEIPGIAVMENGMLWLIEGHHRLRARHRLRSPDFPTYVIEEKDEPALPGPVRRRPQGRVRRCLRPCAR